MVTLWVVGDSTLSEFDDRYYYPRYGYGVFLENYLDKSVEVRNLALSGRSSVSFLSEPEYGELLDGMKDGDFLIAGFGHNDEKTEAARHTSGSGRYDEKGTFANSLYENYYLKAKAAGCTMILCTPIVRRPQKGEWTPECLHVTADQGSFVGGDYPQAVRDMGRELSIPVVDMTSVTKNLYETLGFNEAKYLHAWPSDKSSSVDNTHTNIWGGRVNAYLCLSEIKKLGISGLSEHIVLDEELESVSECKTQLSETGTSKEGTKAENSVLIPSRKYLVSDASYAPVVFNPNLPDSSYWKPYGDWKGTVFGDIPPGGDFSKFTLEPTTDGVRIAVRENAGKIAGVTDGIAMYYRKVPVGTNFTFSAKMRLNSYFKNNQVSFGLMVRDDCYIDTQMPDALGDYVAAAPFLLTRDEDIVKCFARKSGAIFNGGTLKGALQEGETYDVKIISSNDGYALYFGDDEPLTGGFDFKLTAVDPENVYVGMFAARNADVTFTDIRFEENL
jgi:hypothetical protein